MTLIDYVNANEHVVLFWRSVGTPGGDYSPLGHADSDFADARGLNDLEGKVDEVAGDWMWDGIPGNDGKPTDHYGNTILRLHAYVDPDRWAILNQE